MKLTDINERSIRKVSNQELLMLHYRLHQLYSLNYKNKDLSQLIIEKHKIVVKEIKRRKLNHNTKDLLDKTLTEIIKLFTSQNCTFKKKYLNVKSNVIKNLQLIPPP